MRQASLPTEGPGATERPGGASALKSSPALRGCVVGPGKPRLELLFAAVACAGSGVVLGVPVNRLRHEDPGDLNLNLKWCEGPFEPGPCSQGHGKGAKGRAKGRDRPGRAPPLCVEHEFLAVSCRRCLGAEGARLLALFLPSSTLVSLNLEGNAIGPKGAAHLIAGLKENRTLRSLNLSSNFGEESLPTLCEALKNNETLNELRLASNFDFGVDLKGLVKTEGIQALCEMLRTNTTLTELDLRHPNLAGENTERLATAALEHPALTSFGAIPLGALRENSLHELDLSGKSVGVPGAIVLSRLLPSAPALESLKLDQNQLVVHTGPVNVSEVQGDSKEAGAIVMHRGRKMVMTPSIMHEGREMARLVDFSGIAALEEILRVNTTLTSLSLNDNALNPISVCGGCVGPFDSAVSGVAMLANALRENSTLQSLSLLRVRDPNNVNLPISREEAEALAAGLKENRALRSLDLDGHPLNIPQLRGDEPVETLDLSHKGLTYASALIIASLLGSNTATKNLHLEGLGRSIGDGVESVWTNGVKVVRGLDAATESRLRDAAGERVTLALDAVLASPTPGACEFAASGLFGAPPPAPAASGLFGGAKAFAALSAAATPAAAHIGCAAPAPAPSMAPFRFASPSEAPPPTAAPSTAAPFRFTPLSAAPPPAAAAAPARGRPASESSVGDID